jgi:hypothetical protein
MWEPNDEESREVLNAPCRHEPSSVDRQDSSRPPRSVTRFNLGAGGRRFESGHPDQLRTHVDLGMTQPGSQTGSHVPPSRPPSRTWLAARGAGTARTRSTSTTPPVARTVYTVVAARGAGEAQFPLASASVASGSAASEPPRRVRRLWGGSGASLPARDLRHNGDAARMEPA